MLVFLLKKYNQYRIRKVIKKFVDWCDDYYRPTEGGRLYDIKVVSCYAFLRTYYV